MAVVVNQFGREDFQLLKHHEYLIEGRLLLSTLRETAISDDNRDSDRGEWRLKIQYHLATKIT